MKDNFSKQSGLYAQFRPTYPDELFEYILRFTEGRDIAWDCGTGNGQSAVILSNHFKKVIATDVSQKQLDNAQQAPNIFYSVQPAESTDIKNSSIDLITVAQAIHWFDFEKFYSEVKRVANKNCVLAVWGYSLLRINDPINNIIEDYHFNTLASYWDAERKYVDDGYRNIPFPFTKIDNPGFFIETNWSLAELEGYLNTWSALQKFIAANAYNPVPGIISKIRGHWGEAEKRKVIFSIHLLLACIN